MLLIIEYREIGLFVAQFDRTLFRTWHVHTPRLLKVKFHIVEIGLVHQIHTMVTLDFRSIINFVYFVMSHF
jgi:hypothetical protein